MRLPHPDPPSDSLLREIDRFYSALQFPPPIDCIRDKYGFLKNFKVFKFFLIFSEGWEMNGLVEHYVKKEDHKKKLELKMKEEGKTLEDAFTNKYIPSKTPPKSSKSPPKYEKNNGR